MKNGKNDSSEGISIRMMTIGVMIVVAYLCWAIAAVNALEPIVPMEGHTVGDYGGGRVEFLMRGVFGNFINFIGNSLKVHRAPAIAMNTLRNEQWILLMLLIGEGLAVGFGLFSKRLEAELEPPKKRKRKRRSPTGPRDERRKPRREGI
ncbi:MAG: hypothetical protein KDA93_01745 [Planctomycetaceae bacterium]|nr:hypothetical protein [Planctomycetaceae bacterium]